VQVEAGAPKNRIAGFLHFSDPHAAVIYEQRGGDPWPRVHFYFGHPERHYFNPVISKE
jgi:hypothetical protein